MFSSSIKLLRSKNNRCVKKSDLSATLIIEDPFNEKDHSITDGKEDAKENNKNNPENHYQNQKTPSKANQSYIHSFKKVGYVSISQYTNHYNLDTSWVISNIKKGKILARHFNGLILLYDPKLYQLLYNHQTQDSNQDINLGNNQDHSKTKSETKNDQKSCTKKQIDQIEKTKQLFNEPTNPTEQLNLNHTPTKDRSSSSSNLKLDNWPKQSTQFLDNNQTDDHFFHNSPNNQSSLNKNQQDLPIPNLVGASSKNDQLKMISHNHLSTGFITNSMINQQINYEKYPANKLLIEKILQAVENNNHLYRDLYLQLQKQAEMIQSSVVIDKLNALTASHNKMMDFASDSSNKLKQTSSEAISSKNQIIELKNQQIKELKKIVGTLNKQIVSLNQQIHQKNQRLEDLQQLNQIISDRDQINRTRSMD